MNWKKYKEKIGIRKLLMHLGIISIDTRIIPINIEFDDELTEFQRVTEADYYFSSKWSFNDYFENLTNLTILGYKFYHDDDIKELNRDDDFAYNVNSETLEKNLNQINILYSDYFKRYGCDADELEEFKVKQIKIRTIDNIKKEICYEGIYFGDGYGLAVLDYGECGFFAKIKMEGICKSSLHNDLLGESYLLYLSGNYKLSYFVAYSAFENFLNLKTNSFQVQERLAEKLKKLFKDNEIDTEKNIIYCSIINNFSKRTKLRNDIAHGMLADDITHLIIEEFFIEITTMIILYEDNCLTFKELFEKI